MWDDQRPGRLHVVSPGGRHDALGLGWDVCCSVLGTAAVADGRALLLTPLRLGLVPPPMCAARALLPEVGWGAWGSTVGCL